MQNLLNKYEEISRPAICLGVYFMMMPFDSFPVGEIGSLLKIVALLPVAAILLLERDIHIQLTPTLTSFALYCIYAIASIYTTVDFNSSFASIKRLMLNAVVIIAVSCMYGKYNEDDVEFLKFSLVIGGMATLVLTFIFADYSAGGRLTLRINGESQDQNYINGYLFFAYIYFLEQLIQKKKLLASIPIIAIIVFTLMTGSRGALIAVIGITVFSALYILFSNNKMNLSTVLIVAVSLAVLCFLFDKIISVLPESVAVRFSLNYISKHGATGRISIWLYLLRVFNDSDLFRQLFGYGYGTVGILTQAGGFWGMPAHNLWLDHLISGGICGEIVFVIMHIRYICAAWKTKDIFVIGSYVGFLIMMMSLSLISYKPIWNCMMMIMIIAQVRSEAPSDYLADEL